MAYGDVGGAVTELVITCKTPATGTINIAKGDPVKLTGDYTIDNATTAEDPIFGQAMAPATQNGAAIPVKVRGIAIFAYTGDAPIVDGAKGVVASDEPGLVQASATGDGTGINLKVDTDAELVHVLL